jgi:hypothetical protein
MEDISKFTPPRDIILDNYEYSYLDFLINNYYSYWCKHRKTCKITNIIYKTELIILSNIKENEYIILNMKKELKYWRKYKNFTTTTTTNTLRWKIL